MKANLLSALFVTAALLSCFQAFSQGSVDSKICYCWDNALPADFMSGTKAVYGRIGVMVSNGTVVTPAASQPVVFTIPFLKAGSGCYSRYSIYVTDSLNRKVHEQTIAQNKLVYAFQGCNKKYLVTLMAFSKSSSGSAGNCTARLNFTVNTKCLNSGN